MTQGARTEVRRKSAEALSRAGFSFAEWLPEHDFAQATIRPVGEVVGRFAALDLLCLYVSAPKDRFPTPDLQTLADRFALRSHLMPSEAAMLDRARSEVAEEQAGRIGWRMENMVALAWVLGYDTELSFDGSMITGEPLKQLLAGIVPRDPEAFAVWSAKAKTRSLAEVFQMEDLFYCAHNSVRCAQFPGRVHWWQRILGARARQSVPSNFDPIANGGVIHERRHALTWCLSPGVAWDDTDLST